MKKREKIYIIPTEYGFMYGGGIFVSLIGGAIYNNNLAFILCFFLVALFLIGMVQTHYNLRNLNVEKLILFLSPSEGKGHGVIWIKSKNSDGHSQIRIQTPKGTDDRIDILINSIYPRSLHPHYFDFNTGAWGLKKIPKLKVSTRFPFGFFYVWRTFDVNKEFYVFPKPSGSLILENSNPVGLDEGLSRELNGDDFSEHKKYQQGESQKHIDWKAFARGRPLLTKKFNEGQRQTVCIDFDLTRGDHERRYRQLSKWIHDCEQENISYSLKVHNTKVPVSLGDRHKSTCLKLLASQRKTG